MSMAKWPLKTPIYLSITFTYTLYNIYIMYVKNFCYVFKKENIKEKKSTQNIYRVHRVLRNQFGIYLIVYYVSLVFNSRRRNFLCTYYIGFRFCCVFFFLRRDFEKERIDSPSIQCDGNLGGS